MDYLTKMYGKQSNDFVKGFLAAMSLYAVWENGKQTVGIIKHPIKWAMTDAVKELSETPENFDELIDTYC